MISLPRYKTPRWWLLTVGFGVLILIQSILLIVSGVDSDKKENVKKPEEQVTQNEQPDDYWTSLETPNEDEEEIIEEPEEEPLVIIPMLVSKTHVMDESYKPTNLVKIGNSVKGTSSLQINANVLEAYKVMYADIKKDGVTTPAIISAYRPYSKQKQLYDAKVAQYGPGQKVTAAPGTSEHQYAACIDISTDGTCQNNFGELDIGKWVAKNSYKYGFVIRYPSDKKELTGINFEPWHLRYVGVEHATKMYELGYCLEEYVDYLRENFTNTVEETTPDDFPAPRWAGDTREDLKEKEEEKDGEKEGSTAYYNVKTAEGNYAALVNQYIEYERSVMNSDEKIVTFVGDCTLGTWPDSNKKTNYTAIYEAAGSPTYSFDQVKSFFFNDDYTYINLETTLTTSKDKATSQYYNFKGSPSWAKDMIAASGVDGCNLANNHAYDWGKSGYEETVKSIKEAGMQVGDEELVVVTTLDDVEMVLISCNYIYPSGGRSKRYGDSLTEYIVSLVKQYKRTDNIVIVNAHWGLERREDANGDQAKPAHKFIDAGADMVVGHHPHTLQGAELYKGKYIFYSLGNFAFGGKGSTDSVNRIALMLRVRLAKRNGEAVVAGVIGVPCYTTSAENVSVNNYQPRPLCSEKAADIQKHILKISKSYLSNPITELDCPTASWDI